MYKTVDLQKMSANLKMYNETKDEKALVSLYDDILILCRNVLLSDDFFSARSKLKKYEIDMTIEDASLRLLERIIKRNGTYHVEHWLTVCMFEIKYTLFNESKKIWNRTISNETKEM